MNSLKSLRLHIAILGKTNVGKSSLLNKITNQQVSIVSDKKGTTTDVVEKSFELFPIGPVTFLDTAGIDDESDLGVLRIEKTKNVLNRSDIAILITDYNGFSDYELSLIDKLNELKIPFITIVNKSDISKISNDKLELISKYCQNILQLSVNNSENIINTVISELLKIVPDDFINSPSLLLGLVNKNDLILMVAPIDSEAPKGRLILPQVQTIRDALDNFCSTIICQPENLQNTLNLLKSPPKFVITDSQAFNQVFEILPDNIPLTSFSILFARLKGDLKTFAMGAKAIDSLKPDDKILILESCSHQSSEDDIAKIKIPVLISKKLGFTPIFEYKSGHDFPDITPYKFIIHCGACMTNRKEIISRIISCEKQNIPITNFGIIIAYCIGILDRALSLFCE